MDIKKMSLVFGVIFIFLFGLEYVVAAPEDDSDYGKVVIKIVIPKIPEGYISGKIEDPIWGGGVAGAFVYVYDKEGNLVTQTKTNSKGEFKTEVLPFGKTYTVVAVSIEPESLAIKKDGLLGEINLSQETIQKAKEHTFTWSFLMMFLKMSFTKPVNEIPARAGMVQVTIGKDGENKAKDIEEGLPNGTVISTFGAVKEDKVEGKPFHYDDPLILESINLAAGSIVGNYIAGVLNGENTSIGSSEVKEQSLQDNTPIDRETLIKKRRAQSENIPFVSPKADNITKRRSFINR